MPFNYIVISAVIPSFYLFVCLLFIYILPYMVSIHLYTGNAPFYLYIHPPINSCFHLLIYPSFNYLFMIESTAVCLFCCLYVKLSIHLYIYLLTYISHLFPYLSIYSFLYFNQFLSIHLCVYLHIHLLIHMYIHLPHLPSSCLCTAVLSIRPVGSTSCPVAAVATLLPSLRPFTSQSLQQVQLIAPCHSGKLLAKILSLVTWEKHRHTY